MALDLATLAPVLGTLFEDKIAHAIPRAVPLLPFLPVMDADGKNVSWTAVLGGNVKRGGAVADGALISSFNTDTKRPAYLDFAVYEEAFGTTGLARAGARITGNPRDLENLFAEEIEECVAGLTAKIAYDIWLGQGSAATPGEIMGLLDPTSGGILATGTYANIVRGAYQRWAGIAVTNGGVDQPLTKDLMRTLRRKIYEACNQKPDLWACSPLTHQLFGRVCDVGRRQVQDIVLRGKKIALDVGYNYLDFDGVPCIEDPSCPDGYMVALNTRNVRIRALPPDDAGAATVQLHGTADEEQGFSGATGIKAKIKALPYSGDMDPLAIFAYLQLQVKAPNTCGYIGDLPTSL